MAEIRVRSRVKHNREWYTEWMESTRSWKVAWSIVDDCGIDRVDCFKWKLGGEYPVHFLDIGGAEEEAERVERMKSLLGEQMPKPYGNTAVGKIEHWLKQQPDKLFTVNGIYQRLKIDKPTIRYSLRKFVANGTMKVVSAKSRRKKVWKKIGAWE